MRDERRRECSAFGLGDSHYWPARTGCALLHPGRAGCAGRRARVLSHDPRAHAGRRVQARAAAPGETRSRMSTEAGRSRSRRARRSGTTASSSAASSLKSATQDRRQSAPGRRALVRFSLCALHPSPRPPSLSARGVPARILSRPASPSFTHATRAYQSGGPPAHLVRRGSIFRPHIGAQDLQPARARAPAPPREIRRRRVAPLRITRRHAHAPAICQLSHTVSTASTIATATCARAHLRGPPTSAHVPATYERQYTHHA